MSIKFDIKNRFTDEVIFTAEIDADEGAGYGTKLGLAVKAAVKASANLYGANLSKADLAYATLTDANLADADLVDATLTGANLIRANLAGATLIGADLTCATLIRSNLTGAALIRSNLTDANLADANLTGADLTGSNMFGADLNGVCGLNDWIKCIQIEEWPISYTAESLQIGCEQHSFDAWRNFSDAKIRAMDQSKALPFWVKWRETIFKIIEMAPAKPTKEDADAATEGGQQ